MLSAFYVWFEKSLSILEPLLSRLSDFIFTLDFVCNLM